MTRVNVSVKPELLRWALRRSGLEPQGLEHRFPKLPEWLADTHHPTLNQLEDFAKATHTPIGVFFLPEPPEEKLPLPDYRTMSGAAVARPSPDLLDTIYACEQRQEWYRRHLQLSGESQLTFVGSATPQSDAVDTAAKIRHAVGMDLDQRREFPTFEAALRQMIDESESIGVLVMVNGVVGNNTHRTLDPEEFRGFAMADAHAPLVFVNGADTKAAQMFTLAHELAHIWLGESALSDAQAGAVAGNAIEKWCNRVAAELLAPIDVVKQEYRRGEDVQAEADRLAKRFKISSLVALRRIHDAGGLTRDELWQVYNVEKARLMKLKAPGKKGGDFNRTLPLRVSRRFARALVASTIGGDTLYLEAYRLLGIKNDQTFDTLGKNVGVLG